MSTEVCEGVAGVGTYEQASKVLGKQPPTKLGGTFNVCWRKQSRKLDYIVDLVDTIERRTFTINRKVDTLMALVQVEQDQLDALDSALDEVATSLEAKIESLKTTLPDADLSALEADVAALRNLAAPAADAPAE